jgi:DNA-directed RNA polymerase alpha subunit
MPSKGKINNDAVTQKQQKNLALPVTSLNLPSRATNALICDGVHTVAQLVKRTEANLLETPNFGRLSMAQVKQALARSKLRLGMVPFPVAPVASASSSAPPSRSSPDIELVEILLELEEPR